MKLPEEFQKRMQEILKNDYEDFLKSYKEKPIRGIRVNHIKISSKDFEHLFPYPISKIPYTQDGYYLESDVKMGNHPYHHAGLYYMQEPSAMIVANSVTIKENSVILDLCAAPGGKTGEIANLLHNTGTIMANEINPTRAKILLSNIERLGLPNVIISNQSPEQLSQIYPNTFDYVFVDTPCSGEGMFRKDVHAIEEWSMETVSACATRSKKILEYANKMLKQNGYLIYSTCTFSKEENEDVINDFITRHPYEICPVKNKIQAFTAPGIPISPTMIHCRRFYPYLAKGEGQFVAVLQKKEENEGKTNFKTTLSDIDKEGERIVRTFLNDSLTSWKYPLFMYNGHIITTSTTLPIPNHHIVSAGVYLGDIIKKRFIPSHQFFTTFGPLFKNKVSLSIHDPRLMAYLRGEEIYEENTYNGYGILEVEGYPLGGFKASNGHLKNHYPKGLRNREDYVIVKEKED